MSWALAKLASQATHLHQVQTSSVMSSAALFLKIPRADVVFVMRMVEAQVFRATTVRLCKIKANVIFLAGSSRQTKVAVRLQSVTLVATMAVLTQNRAMIFQTIVM